MSEEIDSLIAEVRDLERRARALRKHHATLEEAGCTSVLEVTLVGDSPLLVHRFHLPAVTP